MKVRTAGELGYCFGVSKAIEKAIKYADEHGGRLYTLGTLAHNENVVEYLRSHGIEPVPFEKPHPSMPGKWAKVSHGNIAITAHGAPPEIYERLNEFKMNILDCTCPIVRRAQKVASQQLDGFDIVIFGDPDHQEVIGLNGWAHGAKFVGNLNDLFLSNQALKTFKLSRRVGIISQTTKIPAMFADFVTTLINRNMGRFNEVRVFNTICPIVSARVNETRKLAEEVDMMIVVGSQESANTRNLEMVCRQAITRAQGMVEPWAVTLVQDVDQVGETLSDWWIENEMAFPRVGVTGGTSTPIEVVNEVVNKLKELLFERESGN
ncbi:hypothetical protein LCGC14_1625710 [marine sediment metagenome]|uniref:4-hydroxy-3-methylbut-2-enyl diphosphate reductase n=1 Tax=marine sediment metagenome TaxID=412755 RepID=A0A0F9IR38_9ZZZZ